ncbi:MAG TPA: hypothetical protein DC047_06610 [Blastocatellia bacterium]|nr:hypothetical protein [Blastocatellia bacterium]
MTSSQGRITLEHAKKATDAAKSLIAHLSKDSEGNSTDAAVVELPWYLMPGFYLFISPKRALVVTPLFLPFPKGVPPEPLPEVKMIGIEYRRSAIIRDLKQIYQFYPICRSLLSAKPVVW